VREAVEGGRNEIVLCGTHLGRYGKETGNISLVTLITEIDRFDAPFRVRLSSIEPLEVSDELLEVMGSSKKVCPHLHIPLQSGSDRILEAMRRPYGAALFLSTLKRARAALSNPAITTDIMAGFPGEAEEDHRLTIELARRAGFARAHVFVFSPRPATAAETLDGRVASETARRRAAEIREVCGASAMEFRDGLVGRTVEVLGEVVSHGWAEGFCRRYQRVKFRGNGQPVGRLTRICIMRQGPDGVLEGRTVPQEKIP
jgi:threonylcarbamoyladenosine tRNA methylthiotransferase MtaB